MSVQDLDADPTPPAGDIEVIRHEERLRVGVETVPMQRVRLEKFIVTEQRMIPVEVRREQIRVTREPITDAEPVTGSAASEPVMVTVFEEQVTIVKTVVPIERVTLAVTTVTAQQPITEQLHHEQVTVDHGAPNRP